MFELIVIGGGPAGLAGGVPRMGRRAAPIF